MDIDWSKAPEDATHYDPSDDGLEMPWVKLSEGRFYCWEDNIGWHGPLDPNDGFFGDGNVNRIIPRPTKPAAPEWDGEVLPNIGEMVMHPRYAEPCKLRWLGKSYCVIESSFGDEYFAAMEDLEPIRTKEQRQRDELEYLIESAYATNGVKGVADAMESSYNLEPKDA